MPVGPENPRWKKKDQAQHLSAGVKKEQQDRGEKGRHAKRAAKPATPPLAAAEESTITKADGLTEVAIMPDLAAEQRVTWDIGRSVNDGQFTRFCSNFTAQLRERYPKLQVRNYLGVWVVQDENGNLLARIERSTETATNNHIQVKGSPAAIDTLQAMLAQHGESKILQSEIAQVRQHTPAVEQRAVVQPVKKQPVIVQLQRYSIEDTSSEPQGREPVASPSSGPSAAGAAALTQRLSTVAGEQRDRSKSGSSVAASGPGRTLTLTANSQQEARKKAGTIPVQSAELSLVSAGPDSPKPPTTSQPMQDPKFEEFCKKLADAYDGALPDAKKTNRVTADNALHITQPPPPWSIHQLQNGERQIKVPNDDDDAAKRIIESAIKAKPATSPLVINLDNPKHIELAVKCAEENGILYTLGETAKQAIKNQEAPSKARPS